MKGPTLDLSSHLQQKVSLLVALHIQTKGWLYPYIMNYKIQPPYGGLLNSYCGGLKGLSGPKVILADGQTN